jgi:signal transduction histidine kinase
MQPEIAVDRLAALPLLKSVPRNELAWLVEHGEVRTLASGSAMVANGAPIDEMWIVLDGRAGLYISKAGAQRKQMDAGAGQVLGVLPYSRFHRAPGTVIIEEELTAVVLHRRHFPTLMRDHPELTTALVHLMLDRARDYHSVQLNDERQESLSRLASGFAHELNNPASAAARTAQSLVDLLDEQERSARALAGARLNDIQLAAVDAIRNDCSRTVLSRSALEVADREDDITDWLTHRRLDCGPAQTLAATDVTMAALDDLASKLPPEALGIAIRWAASGCAARVGARQIKVATARIHDLVGAVKGFTFMDRQGVPEDVDVARGLADTLAVLESKVRAKSATVQLETAPDLPRLHGFGSEINQVWQKIVDNALDAVGDQGHVTITASLRGDAVLVRVADDGPGIPEEIRSRIFDPFFTTKPVGQGAGLGLNMARRIVNLHGGDITFSTQPGHTVFRVSLPVAGIRAVAG